MRIGTRAQGATSLSRQHGSLTGCKAHQRVVVKGLVTGLSMWCGIVAASFMAIATEGGTGILCVVTLQSATVPLVLIARNRPDGVETLQALPVWTADPARASALAAAGWPRRCPPART